MDADCVDADIVSDIVMIETILPKDEIPTDNIDAQEDDQDSAVIISQQNRTQNGTEINSETTANEIVEKATSGPPLLRLVFKDKETFDELQSAISVCIRDTLFARKKPIEVTIQHDEFAVCFNALDHGDGLNDSIFMIDILPTENENQQKEVPDYESTNNTPLLSSQQSEPVSDGVDRPKNNCWNCGGDHMLRDCNAPRDSNQINRSKQAFVRNRNDRYHLDADKYSQFSPGAISDDLREAMGIRKRELPLFIYRMRTYGYPPGWLEDAKVSHSGLSLFISEKTQVSDPKLEDGVVEGKITYDPSRFVSYPGFNVKCPSDVRDDYHYFNAPPIQRHQSKDAMIHALQNNLIKSYKRKKLKHLTAEKGQTGDNSVDMDIGNSDAESNSNGSPPEIANVTESPESPPTEDQNAKVSLEVVPISKHISSDETMPESPSMTDLERQKRQLLQELAESGDVTADDAQIDETINLDKTIEEPKDDGNTSASDPNTPRPNSTPRLRSNDSTPLGVTKSIHSGTPLLKSASPFSKLPDGSNWKDGVSDIIDFENLPDAVGTYERLSGLIKKVRSVVKNINDANDAEDDED